MISLVSGFFNNTDWHLCIFNIDICLHNILLTHTALPYPPDEVTVTAASSTALSVTWCAPSSWPSSQVGSLEFRVDYKMQSSNVWIIKNVSFFFQFVSAQSHQNDALVRSYMFLIYSFCLCPYLCPLSRELSNDEAYNPLEYQ